MMKVKFLELVWQVQNITEVDMTEVQKVEVKVRVAGWQEEITEEEEDGVVATN